MITSEVSGSARAMAIDPTGRTRAFNDALLAEGDDMARH
jgi:hypothetical protein